MIIERMASDVGLTPAFCRGFCPRRITRVQVLSHQEEDRRNKGD